MRPSKLVGLPPELPEPVLGERSLEALEEFGLFPLDVIRNLGLQVGQENTDLRLGVAGFSEGFQPPSEVVVLPANRRSDGLQACVSSILGGRHNEFVFLLEMRLQVGFVKRQDVLQQRSEFWPRGGAGQRAPKSLAMVQDQVVVAGEILQGGVPLHRSSPNPTGRFVLGA